MSTPYYHDTPDIVIATTRWPGPALDGIPRVQSAACRRLSFEWRTVSRTPEAAPQPTLH